MDDKCIMENLLLTTKGVIDLYMHGAIESSTTNIHQAFSSAFDDTLCMQDNIYKQMTPRAGIRTRTLPSSRSSRPSRSTLQHAKGKEVCASTPLFQFTAPGRCRG